MSAWSTLKIPESLRNQPEHLEISAPFFKHNHLEFGSYRSLGHTSRTTESFTPPVIEFFGVGGTKRKFGFTLRDVERMVAEGDCEIHHRNPTAKIGRGSLSAYDLTGKCTLKDDGGGRGSFSIKVAKEAVLRFKNQRLDIREVTEAEDGWLSAKGYYLSANGRVVAALDLGNKRRLTFGSITSSEEKDAAAVGAAAIITYLNSLEPEWLENAM